MSEDEKIYVTRPSLPPLDEFTEYLRQIWESRILTNNGPFHRQFEKELADYLGVQYLSLFANGTLALITALQTLGITGEVITTPFSFVATAHALWWNKIKPVFVDIEPEYFTLDPQKIEDAITPDTTAILPVHVYGYPCKTDEIQRIADKYGLKVLYDAAHAFGVKINNDSILNHGDLSVLSFHATKVFNTIEGGAIICHDEITKRRIDYLKNFGFTGETTVIEPGINAKMNELLAAYGLVQLKHIDENILERKKIAELYRTELSSIKGIRVLSSDVIGSNHSYTYFPILVEKQPFGESRDSIYERLKNNNIFTRRYFYPLISQFPVYKDLPSSSPSNLVIAEKISKKILCLPIYPDLCKDDVLRIVKLIVK